jgi:Predicted 3'-5' exonuclease related to the exonuclease domain of PolB
VDAVGAPHVGERTEKELITAFCDKIAQLNPQLVAFNGNSFDLPVLRYRAMVHGVSAPGLSALARRRMKVINGKADEAKAIVKPDEGCKPVTDLTLPHQFPTEGSAAGSKRGPLAQKVSRTSRTNVSRVLSWRCCSR